MPGTYRLVDRYAARGGVFFGSFVLENHYFRCIFSMLPSTERKTCTPKTPRKRGNPNSCRLGTTGLPQCPINDAVFGVACVAAGGTGLLSSCR